MTSFIMRANRSNTRRRGEGATGSAQQGHCLKQPRCPLSGRELGSLGGQKSSSQMLATYLRKYCPVGGVVLRDGGERRILFRGSHSRAGGKVRECSDQVDVVSVDMPRVPSRPPHCRDNGSREHSYCASVVVVGISGGVEDEEGVQEERHNFQDCCHDDPEEDEREEDYSENSKSLVMTRSGTMGRRKSVWGSISPRSLLLGLMLILASLAHSSQQQSFFSPSSEEWDGGNFRSGTYGNGYTCVNTPVNFTLCKNIGYTKMMIPNLLGHDSLQEAEFHAKSWVPLLGLQCHPDTQLFLCSLFSPICLDRPIFPCRSLCQGVQAKCEPRMLAYNYPWPSMLKCDQFPEDHDLCIRPGAANKSDGDPELECPSCNQAHTCENIVDNFCRADFVFRAKYKRSKGALVEFRKERWFKPREGNRRGRELRTLTLDSQDDCCATKLRPGFPYIVMGIKRGDEHVVTFAMQWNGKDKILKNAVRTFRSMDCTNPLPMSVTAAGGKGADRNGTSTGGAGRRKRRKQGRRRGERQYGGCRVSSPGRN